MKLFCRHAAPGWLSYAFRIGFCADFARPRQDVAVTLALPNEAPLVPLAGAHHEKLDGRGYHRGIAADQLSLDARLLTVADIFESLSAARPYREAVPTERVVQILERDAGTAICPTALAGLQTWLARREFDGRVESQLQALEQLQDVLANCDSGCGSF